MNVIVVCPYSSGCLRMCALAGALAGARYLSYRELQSRIQLQALVKSYIAPYGCLFRGHPYYNRRQISSHVGFIIYCSRHHRALQSKLRALMC